MVSRAGREEERRRMNLVLVIPLFLYLCFSFPLVRAISCPLNEMNHAYGKIHVYPFPYIHIYQAGSFLIDHSRKLSVRL
ncbi:hypothetical protein F5B17DRAFT_402453, partial [Nemania serpens]